MITTVTEAYQLHRISRETERRFRRAKIKLQRRHRFGGYRRRASDRAPKAPTFDLEKFPQMSFTSTEYSNERAMTMYSPATSIKDVTNRLLNVEFGGVAKDPLGKYQGRLTPSRVR